MAVYRGSKFWISSDLSFSPKSEDDDGLFGDEGGVPDGVPASETVIGVFLAGDCAGIENIGLGDLGIGSIGVSCLDTC